MTGNVRTTLRFMWRLAAVAALAMTSAMTLGNRDAQASDLNGFLREKGHGDVAISYTSEEYDHFWVGRTKVEDPGVGKVETTSISLWVSYGVTDRFTITADVPWIHADSDGLGEFEEKDLQDFTALMEYRFASLGSDVRSDLVGAFGGRVATLGYEANQPVDIGDGTSDWLFRFVYQLSYRGFYFSQQVGYDLRGKDAPDGYPLYSEVGYTWGPVTVTGLYWDVRVRSGTDIGDQGFTFPSNREQSRRAGGKVYGRINDHLGLAGTYFSTLEGRNTGETSGFSFGVNYSF